MDYKVIYAVGVSRKRDWNCKIFKFLPCLYTKYYMYSKFEASMSVKSALEFWWPANKWVSE